MFKGDARRAFYQNRRFCLDVKYSHRLTAVYTELALHETIV